MKVQLDTVLERDMDLLIIEEFVSSPDFARIFLDAICFHSKYTIKEVCHSKRDADLGESDIVILLSAGNRTFALHIEDKIDAIAMENQHQRYHARAQKDIANGLYEDYAVVIAAPAKYLDENREARKYAHRVTYESLLSHFKKQDDVRSAYKLTLIETAISDQLNHYHWESDADVVRFCKQMTQYQKENYPSLSFGSVAWWPYYPTLLKNASLVLKANKGVCDLQFQSSTPQAIYARVKDYLSDRMNVVKTGKSASVRIQIKPIHFKKDFCICEQEVEEALQALQELHELSKVLLRE